MRSHKTIFGFISLCFLCNIACETNKEEGKSIQEENIMTFNVIHPAQTKASDSGFEAEDCIGLYITEQNLPLEPAGNYITNAKLTYDGNQWTPEEKIFWNKQSYDIFAYYPYQLSAPTVSDMPFEVALDQTTQEGYEASDFLWAVQKNAYGGQEPVSLLFKHRLSKMNIRLVKGDDYEGELPEDAEVYIHNTITSATIDLNVGIVTPNIYGTTHSIQAKKSNKQLYSAIIVPQRIINRQPLIEIIMKGVSYMVESSFVFKAGIQHTITLIISKNPEQIKIEIGGEIENWEP